MDVYIKKGTNYYWPVLYVLKVIEKSNGVNFKIVDSKENVEFFWDHLDVGSQVIANNFYDELEKELPDLSHSKQLKDEQYIVDYRGKKDLVATIFYMINCLQESPGNNNNLDRYGRFKYESSYQFKYNSIEENIVQQYIDSLIISFNMSVKETKSTVFVSHDIDSLYGSLFQDSFWAFRRLNIGVLLNVIANELIRRPHWKNIDKIIKINTDFDIRSTFFWLVNSGKGNQNIKNADYQIHKEQRLLKLVKNSGFKNGLHKSSSDMSINEELDKGKLLQSYNRYHFLNFLPNRDWRKISDSRLQLDASLGFVERYGFRNSYGKAFQPFDHTTMKPFDFVEIPLNIMDGTFHKYMKVEPKAISEKVISFFEKHKYNCCLSFLWHNNYFTDYKYGSFLDQYKKILTYFYESKIQSTTPPEIIKENLLSW